jgi:hypothetical protein
MDEILPGLYLGSEDDASNLSQLQSRGITHVLNAAEEVPCFHPSQITYKHLKDTDWGPDDPRNDADRERVARVFIESNDFISSGLSTGKVLVHW